MNGLQQPIHTVGLFVAIFFTQAPKRIFTSIPHAVVWGKNVILEFGCRVC